MTAWVLRMDGKAVAVAGLARRAGFLELFWDIRPGYEGEMRHMAVLRTIKTVMRHVETSRLPVFADSSNPALLERLGFVCIGGNEYQWATSSNKAIPRARPAVSDVEPD